MMNVTIAKPRAVLFDWDDTVVQSWPIAVEAFNASLVHMGMPAWSEPEIRRNSGLSAKDAYIKLFGEDRWQEADKVYYDTFHRLAAGGAPAHQGAEDVLKFLRGQNVYLGVVSNKRGDVLRHDAAHIGYDGYFDRIVGAGDAAADKPDPAHVLMALGDSGILPGPDVWFVGDSHMDMICAHRAGCTPILIETKSPPEDLLLKNLPALRVTDHGHFMEFIQGCFG